MSTVPQLSVKQYLARTWWAHLTFFIMWVAVSASVRSYIAGLNPVDGPSPITGLMINVLAGAFVTVVVMRQGFARSKRVSLDDEMESRTAWIRKNRRTALVVFVSLFVAVTGARMFYSIGEGSGSSVLENLVIALIFANVVMGLKRIKDRRAVSA